SVDRHQLSPGAAWPGGPTQPAGSLYFQPRTGCPSRRLLQFVPGRGTMTSSSAPRTEGVSRAMPIRFRCPHCQQLLGIARRKAGTPVNCPPCPQSVLVPFQDVEEEAAEVATPTGRQASPASGRAPAQPSLLFERDDFDDLLNASKTGGGG